MGEQKFPEVCTGVLIKSSDDKFLMLKSHKWDNKYCIPGGHLKLGEKAEDCVRREIREETGIEKMHNIEFVCWQEFVYGEEFWKKRHFIFLNYSVEIEATSEEADIKLNEEAQEHVWVTLDEALKLDSHKYTRKVLEEYKKNKGL